MQEELPSEDVRHSTDTVPLIKQTDETPPELLPNEVELDSLPAEAVAMSGDKQVRGVLLEDLPAMLLGFSVQVNSQILFQLCQLFKSVRNFCIILFSIIPTPFFASTQDGLLYVASRQNPF